MFICTAHLSKSVARAIRNDLLGSSDHIDDTKQIFGALISYTQRLRTANDGAA